MAFSQILVARYDLNKLKKANFNTLSKDEELALKSLLLTDLSNFDKP